MNLRAPSQARPNTEQTASARERRPNKATGLRSSASVAESKGGLLIGEFADQKAWENWLQRNHQCQDGVWMKLAKKTAPVKIQTHAEALEAALCYGWIDGQAARYDDHYMLMRFTPRRRRSKWSQINRERAQQLIAQGKMKPAGLAAVQAAKTDRTVRLRSSPARSALAENRRGEKRSIWRKGLWGAVARNFASILVAADAGEPRMA
jgi:hypothetical protein